MPKLRSVTIFEFETDDDIEEFIKALPFDAVKINDLLDGEEVDDEDEIPSVKRVTHKFKIIGEDNE